MAVTVSFANARELTIRPPQARSASFVDPAFSTDASDLMSEPHLKADSVWSIDLCPRQIATFAENKNERLPESRAFR